MKPAPRNPRHILAAAIFLPGSGHVLLGQPRRGLLFLFFMIILGWASMRLMPGHATFIGRHIGGIFIYGMSVIDAYTLARVAWETWHYEKTDRPASADPGASGPS